jgi:hypothetical protein
MARLHRGTGHLSVIVVRYDRRNLLIYSLVLVAAIPALLQRSGSDMLLVGWILSLLADLVALSSSFYATAQPLKIWADIPAYRCQCCFYTHADVDSVFLSNPGCIRLLVHGICIYFSNDPN